MIPKPIYDAMVEEKDSKIMEKDDYIEELLRRIKLLENGEIDTSGEDHLREQIK